MPNCKGTGIFFLRSLFKQSGQEKEQLFLAGLSPEESDLYQNTSPVAMVPMEIATKLYALAAPMLFPEASKPLVQFGELAARSNIKSFHQFLLRLTDVPFIASQAAKIWSLHNDQGVAKAENSKDEKRVVFTINDYPNLPAPYREMLCGYTAGLVKMSGAKMVVVKHLDSDPMAWEWIITWQ
jgi:hypothetical protein